jgi:hypothetical protein
MFAAKKYILQIFQSYFSRTLPFKSIDKLCTIELTCIPLQFFENSVNYGKLENFWLKIVG